MDRAAVNKAPADRPLLELLQAYWAALGVSDPRLAQALSERTLRRLADIPDAEQRRVRAIIAAHEVLDEQLATMLHIPHAAPALLAAQAALLSGAVADWPTALFAPPDSAQRALEQLQNAIAVPVPSTVSATMPAQPIEPIWKRP